jgi:hypothetical protein
MFEHCSPVALISSQKNDSRSLMRRWYWPVKNQRAWIDFLVPVQ